MEVLTIENIANGLAFFVAALLAGLGVFQGRRKAPEPGSRVEVAGALIDGAQARALVAALDANTKALDRCGDQAKDATREIRRMTDELIRSQH